MTNKQAKATELANIWCESNTFSGRRAATEEAKKSQCYRLFQKAITRILFEQTKDAK
jgi:hypothetical protein